MGFSGFRFAYLALFAIAGNHAKRPQFRKRARRENPKNPLIPQILILTNPRRRQLQIPDNPNTAKRPLVKDAPAVRILKIL